MSAAVAKVFDRAPEVRQLFGVVTSADDDGVVVRGDDGVARQALRAVSCLVAPREGDRVLLSGAGAEWYALAVLQRDGDDVSLEAEGDVTLRSRRGAVSVAGAGEVRVMSGEAVRLAAGEVSVDAGRLQLAARVVEHVGALVSAQVDTVKVIAQAIDTSAERVTQRAKRVMRFVEDLDALRAGSVDHAIRELWQVRAKDAMLTARQLVKMDGDQIHMG
jgi:hypothetical protein